MKKTRALRITAKALVFLLGAATVAVGAVFLLQPSLAESFVLVDRLRDPLGNNYDYYLVAGIAGVAVFFGLIFAYQGRAGTVQQAETPDAEGAQGVPAPGDDFDELVSEAKGWRSGDAKDEIRERVRVAAVDVVASTRNCSRYEAENRVDSGGWTADRYASSFLGGSEARKLPLLTRLQVAYGGSPFETAVERTVGEVYAVMKEDETAPSEGEDD
ncbi:MAG: hypothetical protein ACLFSW_05040 [Halobacteriales archaeon]